MNHSENLRPVFLLGSSLFSVILKNLNYGKIREEVAIASEKAAIESENVTIVEAINRLEVNKNTKALRLFQEFGYEGVFGRKDIASLTGDSETTAGGLIKKMEESDLIAEVKGYGKGKYRFSENLGNSESLSENAR